MSEVPVGGVEGLEKVSPVGGESVSVERVSVVDGVSLVEGMLVRGGAPVGAVEVVVLLSEKQVNAQSDSSANENNVNLYSPTIN